MAKLQKKSLPTSCYIIGLCLLILLFFARLFYPQLSIFVTPDFGQSDILHGYYPIRFLLSESLKNNAILLWTNNIASGYPIFADGQLGTFYLPHLLLFKFLPFVSAINISFILTFLIGGIGTFFLAKEFKLSSSLSFLAAIIFCFSGFNISQITHINIIEAGSLLPWELFLVEKLYQKIQLKLVLILALIFSQLIFIGHQEMTVYSFISVFIYYLFRIGSEKGTLHKKYKLLLKYSLVIFVSIFIAIILSAALILPSYELFQNSSTRGINSGQIPQFPYPLENIITFINPFFWGNPQYGTYPPLSQQWGIFWENNGYVGILSIILLPFGMIFLKNRKIVFLLLITITSLLLVLGKNSLLSPLFNFPPLSYFRVPSRFLLLTDLALALLSATILFEIFNKFKILRRYKNILIALIIIVQAGDIFYNFYSYHPIGEANTWFKKPETVKLLQTDKTDFRVFTLDYSKDWNTIFSKEGWINQEKYLPFQEGLLTHSNLFYDIPKINPDIMFRTKRMDSFNNLISFQVLSPNTLLIATNSAKLLGSDNVKFLLGPNRFKITNLDLVGKSGIYNLYKNPYFIDRARIVYQTKIIKDITLKNLTDFDHSSEALVEDDFEVKLSPERCTDNCSNNIKWLKNTDGEIELSVSSSKQGLLILADSYYPGWQAFVDGQKTTIYPVNINQKAIVVNPGEQIVKFVYQPSSFKIGITISLLGYLTVLILLLKSTGEKK